MYKIIGADGKEYGPITAEELRRWIEQGRVNRQTLAEQVDAPGWKPMLEFAEFAPAFGSMMGAGGVVPPPLPALGAPAAQSTGMAVASLVLGICSLVCFGIFAGIPAIILGHMAHGHARRMPTVYGGGGMAIAGFVTGYCSLFTTLMLMGLLLPALANAKGKAESIQCMNHMKQIGLAARIWSTDNGSKFPFNVSTNAGGTLEYVMRGSDGYDVNAYRHFMAMSNELYTPMILVCPSDKSKTAALSFQYLGPGNVTYQLHTGPNVDEKNPTQVLAVCPIHGTILYCDGRVVPGKKR
jgi:Domain of unknown function (DUF4190)/GYF domain 2